jgi:hypothetical protein
LIAFAIHIVRDWGSVAASFTTSEKSDPIIGKIESHVHLLIYAPILVISEAASRKKSITYVSEIVVDSDAMSLLPCE